MQIARLAKGLGALVVGATAVLALPLTAAHAATFDVTTTTDGGAGSLRDAVAQANASAGADVIQVPAGTYTLTLGQMTITDEVTIVGLGGAAATVIDAGGANRIFESNGDALTIEGLTLRDGTVTPQGAGAIRIVNTSLTIRDSVLRDNHARFGGAIYAAGVNVVIEDSEFVGNRTDDFQASGGGGGALHIEGASTLAISGSTFEDNRALNGNGGAIVSTTTTGTITNSTFVDNGATGNGGAFRFDNGTVLSLRYVTIAGNDVVNSSLGGGILAIGSGSATLTNTLLVDNVGNGTPSNCGTNNGGIVASGGGNLSNDATCTAFSQPGDLNDDSATTLGSLADNGGPTRTLALIDGSSAIDAAPCQPGVSTVDQRGITRPQGASCDIGAFELEQVAPTTTTTAPTTTSTTPPGGPGPAAPVTADPNFTG